MNRKATQIVERWGSLPTTAENHAEAPHKAESEDTEGKCLTRLRQTSNFNLTFLQASTIHSADGYDGIWLADFS